MIALRGISKSFAGVHALRDVDFTGEPGNVHGLLGENGAGKSTLMHILCGLHRADRGSIHIAGKACDLRSPRDARRLGIGMVHQHFTLVPTLDLGDNLSLALGESLFSRQRTAILQRCRQLAADLGWNLDITGPLGRASVGQQQRVEIVKALAGGGSILILDEPTAVLAPQEVDELLPALRRLADQGKTVIMITHKLDEVTRCCDTVSVLRRGVMVHQGRLADSDRETLAQHMVGSTLPPLRERAHKEPGAEMLRVRDLQVRRDDGSTAVDAVTLTLRRGSITGIAGVDGNGQRELVEALCGLRQQDGGHIEAIGARRAIIPDDRLRHALVAGLSVRDNLLLREGLRPPLVGACGWLHLQRWNQRARDLVKAFDIRTPSITLRAGQLSGGNQQKVVAARELADAVDIVIAMNPTRGLDIGAARFVIDRLIAARDADAAVLLVNSDLDELLSVVDELYVMYDGHLHPSPWPNTDRADVGRLMLGLGID